MVRAVCLLKIYLICIIHIVVHKVGIVRLINFKEICLLTKDVNLEF